jgi:hypothetical protein
VVERKLAQERAGTRTGERKPVGPAALAAEAIQARLDQIRDSGG